MALHCFNLFFPCTNILQVKCMHRLRALSIVLSRWRQNSQQFRDFSLTMQRGRARYVCEIFAGPAVCGPGGGREREGLCCKVYVRPISSRSYWLECWQCRQECGDRSIHTLTHSHTPAPGEAGEGLSQTLMRCEEFRRI